jgi:acetoin utilization deacetylase AcuC-like enzyme
MRVVYSDLMVAELLGHISPSSFKPGLLLTHLQALGFPLEVHSPIAVSRQDLELAHHPEYVDEILECRENNGFGNKDPDIARTLPYTSGSLYRAGQLALEYGIAASFSSGFHHAHYDRGGGFCTFNGLIVASRLLHREGVERILILDLDYHYGDGTDQIISTLDLDFIRHETFGAHYRDETQADEYLAALDDVLDSLRVSPVDLILYQAGADVHIDDPLGGLLTSEQMAIRDRKVFEAARALQIPIAWNLAGGYQRDENETILPVLRLHEETYRIAEEIYSPLPKALQ